VLDRRRTLSARSLGGIETYTVALVTDPVEMEQGARELSGGAQRVTSCCASMRASTAARAGERSAEADRARAPSMPAADRGGARGAGQGLRAAGGEARIPRGAASGQLITGTPRGDLTRAHAGIRCGLLGAEFLILPACID
jgi:hypothetical protein